MLPAVLSAPGAWAKAAPAPERSTARPATVENRLTRLNDFMTLMGEHSPSMNFNQLNLTQARPERDCT